MTGGTRGIGRACAEALQAEGANQVFACATHGVLSGPALERISESPLEQVIVTNTIPCQEKIEQCSKLTGLPVSQLLSEAIRRIHNDESVSSLFV